MPVCNIKRDPGARPANTCIHISIHILYMCRRICCSVDERGRGGSFFDSAIIITSVSAILCGDDAQAGGGIGGAGR